MAHSLRIAAAAIIAAAVAIGGWSLVASLRMSGLAFLPEAHTSFGGSVDLYLASANFVLLLVGAAGGALGLMALAQIIARLDSLSSRNAGQGAGGQSGSRFRIVSARLLRIAALAVLIVWIVVPALPFLWLALAMSGNQPTIQTHFVVVHGDVAAVLAPALIGALIALSLVALAAVLERLDRLGARRTGDE